MKKIIIFIFVLFQFNSIFSEEIKLDDFESIGSDWQVSEYGYKALTSIDIENATEGIHSFKIDFDSKNFKKNEKVILEYVADLDLSSAEFFAFDAFNASSDDIVFTVSVSTGAGWEWHESKEYVLKPGANNGIKIDLRAEDFKTEDSQWKNSAKIKRLDLTRRITVNFIKGKGPLYMDNTQIILSDKKRVEEKPETTYHFSDSSKLNINSFTLADKKVEYLTGQKIEFIADISGNYKNAFDYSEMDVNLIIETKDRSPLKIPAFFNGDKKWIARYTPLHYGEYQFYIIVTNNTEIKKSEKIKLMVNKKNFNGFIKIAENKMHFEFSENKNKFFPVGCSFAWIKDRSKTREKYDYYFRKLKDNNANLTRIWMTDFAYGIEWIKNSYPNIDYYGLKQYSLENSKNIDIILELAEKYGIYIILTFGTYGELKDSRGYWGEENWKFNPYNSKNGGPCESPNDFFTDKTAIEIYKNRIKYIIARWSYSSNILAFDIWNEVDAPVIWVKEISEFIKAIDINNHLVSTTFTDDNTNNLASIDFTKIHLYGWQGKNEDLIAKLNEQCVMNIEKFNKPCFVEEFGIDAGNDDIKYDPDGNGINLHNGLWASAFSGCANSSLNWWWDTYVDAKNLYYQYTPISLFFSDIKLNQKNWKVINLSTEKVRVFGIKSFDEILLWCHNKESNWYNTYKGAKIQKIYNFDFKINDLSKGKYKLNYFDSWKGNFYKTETINNMNNFLNINIPELERDIAIKIKKVGE